MKTSKPEKKDVRTTYLIIPMSKNEKDEVKQEAENRGLTMTGFARMLLKNEIRGKKYNKTK